MDEIKKLHPNFINDLVGGSSSAPDTWTIMVKVNELVDAINTLGGVTPDKD